MHACDEELAWDFFNVYNSLNLTFLRTVLHVITAAVAPGMTALANARHIMPQEQV